MFNRLAVYGNAVSTFLEFRENNRLRQLRSSYFNPENFLITPISHFITKNLSLPLVKKIPGANGDWITTRNLQDLCEKVEHYSGRWQRRTPSTFPGIYSFDASSIEVAKQAHVFARDANFVLRKPKQIRDAIDVIANTAKEQVVDPIEEEGKKFKRASTRRAEAKGFSARGAWTGLASLVGGAVAGESSSSERLLKDFVEGAKEWATGAAVETGTNAVTKTAAGLLEKFKHDLISEVNEKEKELRETIIAKATDSLYQNMLNMVTSQTLRGALCFVPVYYGFHSAGITSLALSVIGSGLWFACLKPSVDRLSRSRLRDIEVSPSIIHDLRGAIPIEGYLKEKVQSFASSLRRVFASQPQINERIDRFVKTANRGLDFS